MKEPKAPKQKSSKKKHKKEKHEKHKKHRRRHSSSSSGDSDGSPARGPSVLSQLERDRAAVQAARYILATHPGMRKSFRELLWELDNGRAVGLSGVPDAVLRSQLQYTLEQLSLKCTKGQYWLPSGAPTTLSVIGFVFDEAVRQVPAPPPGMITAAAAPAAAAAAPAPAAAAVPASPPKPVVKGPQLPPDMAQQQQQQQQQHDEDGDAAPEAAGAAVGPAVGLVLGPAPPPASRSTASMGDGDREQQQQQQQQQDDEQNTQQQEPAAEADMDAEPSTADPPAAAMRRVVGPAAPSAELLAAAAAYHAEVEAAGGYGDSELLVGPPPPDFVDEADAAPADAREAQVVRVLRVLREAASAGQAAATGPAPGAAAAAAAAVPDAYAVLGVEPTSDTGTIRKSYWRLSLLVHPDKCSHPAAQEVFQAVSKAAQLLQDAEQRKQLDKQQAEAGLRRQALAAAEAAEREVAWKVARGEAVPPELAAALAAAKGAGAGPAARESWMTELPSQQRSAAQALAGLSQVSQTSFSRFGTRQLGDTSAWTDTPQQRELRAAGLLTDSSSARLALAAPSAAVEGGPVSAELMAAMSQYTQQHRHKSLLEQHAEQKAQQGKKQKKEKEKEKSKGKDTDKEGKGQKRRATDEPDKEADWVGKHPWQPFDRDKDMTVQVQKPKGAADLLRAAGSLSNRFSSGR